MRLLTTLLVASGLFAQDYVVVRAIRFEHFKRVPASELRDRLNEREARLSVDHPYRPEDAEEARRFITELLAEKGLPGARIEIATRAVAPRRVEVRFKLVN